MSAADWAATGANAAAVTLLLRAAPGKLAAPRMSAAAVSELLPGQSAVSGAVIRAFAIGELAAAYCVVIPALRLAGAVLIAALGAVFAGFGVAGASRGSTEPCGCFGERSSAPLGPVNVVLGLVFLGAAAIDLGMRAPHDPETSAALSALTAVIVATGWSILARRGQAAAVLRNVRSRSESA